MLNLIYFTFTSALFFKYGIKTNIPSLVIFSITSIIIVAVLLKFYFDPYQFGYFRFSFRCAYLAINHWNLHIIVSIALPLLMILLPIKYSWMAGISCVFLLLFTIIYRPYIRFAENLRSVFNLLVMCSFIGFRFFTQNLSFTNLNSISTYIFLFVIVAVGLSLVLIIGLISSIYFWY